MRQAMDRGELDEAERLARDQVLHEASDPNGWETLSKVLSERGDDAAAERAIRDGIDRTGSFRLRYLLSELVGAKGDNEHARRLLTTLREERPDSPLPYRGLANAAQRDGQTEEARSNALAAVARADTPWTYYWASMQLLRCCRDFDVGSSLMRRASDEMPREPLPALCASVLLEKTDPPRSARYLNVARRFWGEHPEQIDAARDEFRSEYLEAR